MCPTFFTCVWFFLNSPYRNRFSPWCTPPQWSPLSKKQTPYWKVKPLSRRWFLEKTPNKSGTVISTCVSVIKQCWKKMAEIPQECDFLTWSIQNFVKKVKQFVRKCYITWLIVRLVVFNIAVLMLLFCNCLLFPNLPDCWFKISCC